LPESFAKYAHGLGIDTVARPRSIDFSGDQAGVFKGFQVLRNRCLGQWHDIDNLATNASAAAGEDLQYCQPGRMRKRLARNSERFKVRQILFGGHAYIVHRRYTISKHFTLLEKISFKRAI
jgi:hypothetical protein